MHSDGRKRAVPIALTLRGKPVEQSYALGRLHVRQPVHRDVARVDLAVWGKRADALHRVAVHTEENHRVIRRFQMDHTRLAPPIAHVIAAQSGARRRHAVTDPRRLRLRVDQAAERRLQSRRGGTRIHLRVDQQLWLCP